MSLTMIFEVKRTILHLLILITHCCLSLDEDLEITVSCPAHQTAFGGSCYEFVDLEQSSFSAQAWCEQNGGHLAFIPDEDTQYFLQRHLDPEKDVWLGVAPPASPNLQDSPTDEGPLAWLDGSHIAYSNWLSSPQPGHACGHIVKNSGFQWKSTRNCKQDLHFVCQFEYGRSIMCAGCNTTLQCSSGQVLMIDGGFYGRNNIHYCRSTPSATTTRTQHQCGWVDVGDSLTAHCQSRQVCHLAGFVDSFGEPCPQLGSYLFVNYRCRDGLSLSVSTAAAVFSDVTISVRWLLHLPRGNISCKLSTGDNRVVYLHSSEGLESSVMHKYTHPRAFVVTAECTIDDIHITAQKEISIQEPITAFGVIKCNAGDQSFKAANCKAHYGEPFKIQIEVKAGTNVTYRIQSGEALLSSVSVVRGTVPQNITVTPGMVKQLGPGCHQLILYASNTVTSPEASTDLQASALADRGDCLDSSVITVTVSVEQGAPVLLLFTLSGNSSSLSETREMNTNKESFHIQHPIQGSLQVRLRAWNVFSSVEVDVDMSAACDKDPIIKPNTHNNYLMSRLREKHVRVIRSPIQITATPSVSVTLKNMSITLTISKGLQQVGSGKRFEWACNHPCNCQGRWSTLTHIIQTTCLPDPFQFNKYHFSVINNQNEVESTESICITYTPIINIPNWLSFSCIEGCNSKNKNTDAKIRLECNMNCPQIVWNIEDLRDETFWPAETISCYKKAGKRPLTETQHGGTQYTVRQTSLALARSKGKNVIVVITSADIVPIYATYTIEISVPTESPRITTRKTATTAEARGSQEQTDAATTISGGTTAQVTNNNSDGLSCSISPKSATILEAFSITCNTKIPCSKCKYCFKAEDKQVRCSKNNEVNSVFLPLGDSSSNYNLIIKATATHSSFEESTTITAQVLDTTEATSSSVNHLQATVENTVALLQKQGLLSGETLGQIFSSVSNKLNDQTDESKKADRQKLREQMLDIMADTLREVPSSSPEEVQVIARGLTALIQKGDELSDSAQEEASSLFASLSSSLLDMGLNKSEENEEKVQSAVSTVVGGVSDILHYSSNKNVSDALFFALNNAQSALLMFKETNEGPTVIQQDHIGVFVQRVTPETLHMESIHIHNFSSAAFSLPILPSDTFPSEEPVDIRMLSLDKNPFSWNKRGNISGLIGGLSLTTKDGSAIPVENLSEYIEVGVQTTHSVTQCLCNHLTFFGSSFFVTPNLVDPSRSADLFGTFAENPVVVCFVGALFVAYLVVVVWARRKDMKDTAKVKVSVLEDNNPMDEYRYLLSVSTGHRRGASTSSQVTITLQGADGNSEPHHLTDPKKCVFERGAVDLFLLTTPFSLGDLHGIRLWHNNSGKHPAWYVSSVVVQDLQTEQKWYFLCNSWLAIDVGDCSLDKVCPVSTEMDLKRFSNLFFMKTTRDFSDGHLWYSVISRPPSSTFTCVQRVSCCFSLLLSTMLTSIMFYGIPTDPSEQTMDLGHFEFTWQQFIIGVQSSLIMFPVNILIVSIFRNTRPRETSCCKREKEKTVAREQIQTSHAAAADMNVSVTLDSLIKDITRITSSLSKTVKSNIPPTTDSECGPGQPGDINAVLSVVEDFIRQNNKISDTIQSKTQELQPPGVSSSENGASRIQKKSNKTRHLYRQLCHIDEALSQLGDSGFTSPHSYSQALHQVQGMKDLLQDRLCTSSCMDLDELMQKKYKTLSFAESGGGGDDGNQKKRQCCHGGLPWWFIFVGWLLVIATSCVAGYFTMLYGLKYGKERSISWLISMIVSFFQSILVIQPLKVLCLAIFFALVIKRIEEKDLENVPLVENDRNSGDCKDTRRVERDSSLYEPPPPGDIEKMRMNKIKEQKAYALLREILTFVGFMWMLLLAAYGQRDPNAFLLNQHIRRSFCADISDSMSLREVVTWVNTSLLSNLFGVYPGFITDGNSKLVGNARLRQVRVQPNSCQIAESMLQFVLDCRASYSWEVEDTGSYDPGWKYSVTDNTSTSTFSPWKYQTAAQLRAYPIRGRMALYRGGGFVAELGPDSQNASSTLEYLFTNSWLDVYTRAIFVEFTVYNANVNLFCIVTLLLETTAGGAFQFYSELHAVRLYQSTAGLHVFVMAAEIIYLLFIIYYMFLQGKLMKQQRWAYLKSKWNLLELTIILLTWSAVAIFIRRTLLGNRDMTYYQNNKDQFASFYETVTADLVLQYLIAFVVLLATIKLWHLLRLNPKMNIITASLQRAWKDMTGFLVVIAIMLMAYAITCNVMYGWKMSSYRTLLDALLTLISLQMGIFNYEEVLDYNLLLGALLVGSCVVFMTFVVLNLFISVILVAFSQEQIYHKPSEEEEIVDLLLKKICSLFGIRYRVTKDAAGSDTNSGRNVSRKTSVVDVNNIQTSDNSVNP
ncbi:hypothetical protein PAMA_003475 [Pampus argenteus]